MPVRSVKAKKDVRSWGVKSPRGALYCSAGAARHMEERRVEGGLLSRAGIVKTRTAQTNSACSLQKAREATSSSHELMAGSPGSRGAPGPPYAV